MNAIDTGKIKSIVYRPYPPTYSQVKAITAR